MVCDGFASRRILGDVSQPSSFAIDVPSALLARARQGDIAAYEQIYRWFERPIFTLALRLLGEREDAQDVLQETMIKLYNRIGEFRNEAPFWSWLRQIAVNESLMRLRKRNAIPATDDVLETDLHDHEQLLPPAATDAALLTRALGQLPDTTRSVLWLYHGEGYTHEQIAGLMGKTASFSKSQLARGTRRLRDLLAIRIEVHSHA